MKKRNLKKEISDGAIKPIPKPGKKINWKRKLWRVFSIYVRLRDALPESGLCYCISCFKRFHWSSMDCGHYINRRFTAIIYNEINNNAQCRQCNRFTEGNQHGYYHGLIKKYNVKTVEVLGAAKGFKKYHDFELQELYKIYQEKIKVLKKEKGL